MTSSETCFCTSLRALPIVETQPWFILEYAARSTGDLA